MGNYPAIQETTEFDQVSFNYRLYAASVQTTNIQDNYLICPISLLILLSSFLGSGGPRGNTTVQLCSALFGPNFACNIENADNSRQVAMDYTESLSFASMCEKQGVIKTSNAIFIQQGFQVLSSFKERFIISETDHVASVNFSEDQAYSLINNWINLATEGLVNNLFKNEDFDDMTKLVILNTIYFKGQWKNEFNKIATTNSSFEISPNKTIKVPMMSQISEMLYSKNEHFHLIAKKFLNHRFKFVVILPTERHKIETLNTLMQNNFKWKDELRKAQSLDVHLKMPRFSLEKEINIKLILNQMGVEDLFNNRANLSGISKTSQLVVDKMRQKSVLKVHEYGVEAAAVTTLQISTRMSRNPQISFFVDQPFYCAIYDSYLEIPLFFGRVIEPTPLTSE